MRYRDLAMSGAGRLVEAGMAKLEAARDARLLLMHASGLDRAAFIAGDGDFASDEAIAKFEAMIARRAAGEPVSRIVGRRDFFGLSFQVTLAVLDPRPETEVLVERVLADCPERGAPLAFADIGTGSGAIAVALLVHLPAARCVAIDLSADALKVAAGNAETYGVAARFDPRQGDFLQGQEGPFHFIVSNPPYIAGKEIGTLEREVRDHDPRMALDGGEDGLDAYRALLAQAGAALLPGGALYLEIGAGQAEAVRALATKLGWQVEAVVPDLAGIERVVVARRA